MKSIFEKRLNESALVKNLRKKVEQEVRKLTNEEVESFIISKLCVKDSIDIELTKIKSSFEAVDPVLESFLRT